MSARNDADPDPRRFDVNLVQIRRKLRWEYYGATAARKGGVNGTQSNSKPGGTCSPIHSVAVDSCHRRPCVLLGRILVGCQPAGRECSRNFSQPRFFQNCGRHGRHCGDGRPKSCGPARRKYYGSDSQRDRRLCPRTARWTCPSKRRRIRRLFEKVAHYPLPQSC